VVQPQLYRSNPVGIAPRSRLRIVRVWRHVASSSPDNHVLQTRRFLRLGETHGRVRSEVSSHDAARLPSLPTATAGGGATTTTTTAAAATTTTTTTEDGASWCAQGGHRYVGFVLCIGSFAQCVPFHDDRDGDDGSSATTEPGIATDSRAPGDVLNPTTHDTCSSTGPWLRLWLWLWSVWFFSRPRLTVDYRLNVHMSYRVPSVFLAPSSFIVALYPSSPSLPSRRKSALPPAFQPLSILLVELQFIYTLPRSSPSAPTAF
jgi:hypothetical protein